MDSLITYFEVLSSFIIAFFFIKWLVVKIAECDARMLLRIAIRSNNDDDVKAILIAHANRLSSEVKLDAQNWLDERSN